MVAGKSKMFGVPVEKHGFNGEPRHKGKIMETARASAEWLPKLKLRADGYECQTYRKE